MSTEQNGKQNWLLILSVFGVVASVVAGASVIIDLKIENGVARATASKNEELAALRADSLSRDTAFNAKLTEIETQFRAEDQMRNVQWAEMRRTISLLWESEFKTRYPSEIQFYPSIAQPSR